MIKEYQGLFDAMAKFRKLHFSSIMPNMTHSEFMMLQSIVCIRKRESSVSISNIAKKMDVPSAAISRGIKHLEEKNYVIRNMSQKDRRNIYVEITDAGRAALAEAEEIMTDVSESIAENMGRENLEQLGKYLLQLYEVAQEEVDRRKG